MKVIKAPKAMAEIVKRFLLKNDIYETEHAVSKDESFIYFPILDEKRVKARFPNLTIKEKSLEPYEKTLSFKNTVSKELTKSELEHLKTGYDLVGNIAIIEIDRELVPKEKIMAKILLDSNKNIKTVLKKLGSHEGEFRTQKLKYLAGKKTKETIHNENNVKLKINVEDVYFSPRLSTERRRIADAIRPEEVILVMFSGCGVYPIVFSKNSPAKEIIGIEINPVAHKYALENMQINKSHNVKFYLGDVRDVAPHLSQKFDRILLPLPKSAESFLDIALSLSKKGTIIHFYDFLNEAEFKKAEMKVGNACKNAGLNWKRLALVKCGQHSPHVYRICLDFKIL